LAPLRISDSVTNLSLLKRVKDNFEKLAGFRYLGAVETLELAIIEKEIRKETKLEKSELVTLLTVPATSSAVVTDSVVAK